jgi:NADPH:quinone reductase-like Zn-dependent oxidoreductase
MLSQSRTRSETRLLRRVIKTRRGDEVVCTEDEDLRGRLQEITDGKGIDYAIDCVAGEVGRQIVRNLAPTGMPVQFGALSSQWQTDRAKLLMPVVNVRRRSNP